MNVQVVCVEARPVVCLVVDGAEGPVALFTTHHASQILGPTDTLHDEDAWNGKITSRFTTHNTAVMSQPPISRRRPARHQMSSSSLL